MTATSSTTLRAGFSNSTAARAFPTRATIRRGSSQKQKRLAQEGREEAAHQRTLSREQEWISSSPRARQAKSKARYQRYEDLLKQANDKQTTTAQIVIPVAERLGQNVVDFEGLTQGLWRPAADRRSHLQAAARRHRRRDRSERRGQDHAVPHDHRAGEAGQGHDHRRRECASRLCRPVARFARPEEERLGGNLRRQRPASCSASAR